MFLNTDCNTFISKWIDYNGAYNKVISENEARSLFNIIKQFAPCTIRQFAKQIDRSFVLYANPLKIQELMELASFDGHTKEQAKAVASKRWRVLYTNLSDYCDYCFSDYRACISFYLCFGSVKQFISMCDTPDKNKNEPFFYRRFVENYLNCSINDNLEIIRYFTFYCGWQSIEPRQVIPIGEVEDVKELCDQKFGVGKWGLWRKDLFRQHEKLFDSVYKDSNVDSVQKIQKAQIELMQKVIDELEEKPTDLMLDIK